MKTPKKIEPTKAHAKFGASSSERWLNCPGSVALSMKAPPEVESRYAKEGTDAHECVETFLQAWLNGQSVNEVRHKLEDKFPSEMVRHAEDAFETIQAMAAEYPDSEVLCETKVKLDFVEKDEFGTIDAGIVALFDCLTVIDYKYGAGIRVDPEQNSQLIYYALGIAHEYNYEFSKVRIVVIQPRAFSADGKTVREWETTVEELKKWAKIFKDGIAAAKKPDAPLSGGDHCQFCRAKPICPEISTRAIAQAQAEFDVVDDEPKARSVLPDVKTLNEKLHIVLPALNKIEEWISSVREYAFERLNSGHQIEGYKLVDKRGSRKWKSTDVAFEKTMTALFGDYYSYEERKLVSPAKLEEKLGSGKTKELVEKFLAEHASMVSSGVTMVPASDKREAVKSAVDEFDEVPDEFELFQEEFIETPPVTIVVPAKAKPKKKLPKHPLQFKQKD